VNANERRKDSLDFKVSLLRTSLFALRGRAPALVDFLETFGLLDTPAKLAEFNVTYAGCLNDNGTVETSTDKTPEKYSLWVWATFRPEGRQKLEDTLRCTRVAAVIGILGDGTLKGFGGTLFSAKTVIHLLQDANKGVGFMKWHNDDYRLTGIGPNPRKLINLMSAAHCVSRSVVGKTNSSHRNCG
jgi:hypothetical protein